MKSVQIHLSSDTVNSFTYIVGKYDYEADIRYGRYVVDAKSVLGIFSLGFPATLVLEIHSDSCDDLIAELSPFII